MAVAPPPRQDLPRVTVGGPEAAEIIRALETALASSSIAVGSSYEIEQLDCSNVSTPQAEAVSCLFDVKVDGGQSVAIDTGDAVSAAQAIFDAFTGAGAMPCIDAHRDSISLRELSVAQGAVEFADASIYSKQPAPNVNVTGSTARGLVDAFKSAGIDDCNPERRVFLACHTVTGGGVECGYQLHPVVQVEDSWLQDTCRLQPVEPGGVLDGAQSLQLWGALLAAAKASNYQPLNGTLDEASVVNASTFSWDGEELSFSFTADNPGLPP
jgi:hypothetical protein